MEQAITAAGDSMSTTMDAAGTQAFLPERLSLQCRQECLHPKLRGNEGLAVSFFEGKATLREWDGLAWALLDENLSAGSTLDAAYDVQIVVDGAHVQVWRGAAGQEQELVLEADDASVLSGDQVLFYAMVGDEVRYDDIAFNVDDPETTTFAYNTGNELTTMTVDGASTTFTYDDWGRTVSKTTGGNSAVYSYQYGDKLKKITSTIPGDTALVEYEYDGLGKRRNRAVGGTVDTWYRWDLGWNVVAEYAHGGSAWDVGTRELTYAFAPGGSVGRVLAHSSGSNPSTGTYSYYVHDHLRSTAALYDDSMAVEADFDFAPYGSILNSSNNESAATRLFTGHAWDVDAGLHYTPYRYLSSQTAKWLTRDPLASTLNLYAYGKANPIYFWDPSGGGDQGYFGGNCCNFSSTDEWACVGENEAGEGEWRRLEPGECTGISEDCDGMSCNGGFYYVKPYDLMSFCWGCGKGITGRYRRWVPGGDGQSPTARGCESDTPPGYEYDED